MLRIVAVPEYRGHGYDPLMLIVRKRHENMHGARYCVLRPYSIREENESSRYPREFRTGHQEAAPLTSRSNSTAYSAPSGVSSCLK
jgi:hypothetical protein